MSYHYPPNLGEYTKPRNYGRNRRRVAFLLVMLMVATPFMAAGTYLWNITQAIESVQSQSVEKLPERRNLAQSGATPVPQSIPSTNPPPSNVDIAKDILGTGTGIDAREPEEVWPGQDYINVLVLGVDTRADGGDQNADVIIIARIDFQKNEVRAVSLPRDLQVEVPGYGKSKINGAYNLGVLENPTSRVSGVAMMRDTIEYNFGIRIDEYLLVDFDGFRSIIDAVGGITIDVPERIEDDQYPTEDYGGRTLIIEAGRQQMDGETALAYARTRHQDSDDFRRERQMLVIRALLDKGQSLGSLTKITQIIRAAGDTVLTSIDWQKQLALAGIALHVHQDDIVMRNIVEPLVTPGTSATGAWIYIGDPQEIGAFIENVLSGSDSDGSG